MREIKFRAWDKYDKIMIDWCEVARIHTTKGFGISNGVNVFFDNIMQFTGLKDKNSKEIYEGDIVKSTNRKLGECIAVVGFSEKESAFVLLEGYGWQRPDEFFSTWNKVYEFEVIGNIYENPELTKHDVDQKGDENE